MVDTLNNIYHKGVTHHIYVHQLPWHIIIGLELCRYEIHEWRICWSVLIQAVGRDRGVAVGWYLNLIILILQVIQTPGKHHPGKNKQDEKYALDMSGWIGVLV